mgnify:CR=1 FL=1
MSNKYDRHYPAIPLRNVTVFPGMVMHFDVSRKKSVKAVEASSLGISIYRPMYLEDADTGEDYFTEYPYDDMVFEDDNPIYKQDKN